jgi:hypothetical protein
VIVGLLTRANTVGPNFSRAKARRPVSTFGLLAMVACAPDVDFLWGRHSAETHSLGAIVIVGLIAFALSRGTNLRLVVAVALAWGSHIFLDWLGSDTTPPIGVMALWPFSNDYFFAYAYVFESITRRYWLPNFWTHNVWAVVTEATILGPIVAFLVWMRRVR